LAPSPAALSNRRASEADRLDLGDDPAVQETWRPKVEREQRHEAIVNGRVAEKPSEHTAPRRKSKRGTKKTMQGKRRPREEREDESVNDTTKESVTKATRSEAPPQLDIDKVRKVGQELAQVLQGANIGKVEFNINIITK
jgi:hypothetical protein